MSHTYYINLLKTLLLKFNFTVARKERIRPIVDSYCYGLIRTFYFSTIICFNTIARVYFSLKNIFLNYSRPALPSKTRAQSNTNTERWSYLLQFSCQSYLSILTKLTWKYEIGWWNFSDAAWYIIGLNRCHELESKADNVT